MLPSGTNGIRAVFYLDIAPGDVRQAVALIGEVLRALPAPEPAASAADSAAGVAQTPSYDARATGMN
jgi:hypothetical protein